jgi:hypothetical protein
MNSTEVTISIMNVWTESVLPEQLRVFTHSNGVDAIMPDGDGFQCEDTDGDEIDIEGDNELTLECHRAPNSDQWLAVIDVVITDENIWASNNVPHPCFLDDEPILESCAWRIIIPCVSEDICTDEPSSSPTSSPTFTTNKPTSSPTSSPTIATVEPTSKCPGDILLVSQKGVTELPSGSVEIVSQDSATVTVSVTQSFTSSNSTIDQVYYQYKPDVWDVKCFEEDGLNGGDSFEITIECTRTTRIASLELWIADDISKNVLSDLDQAVIPDCCYPSTPENTPVSKYLIEIKCKTECPEVVA